MDTNIKDMENETKAKRTPTPQLNQACHTRRDFEAKVDLHETTQGERYHWHGFQFLLLPDFH